MELAIKTKEIEWWFWTVTLPFIIFALIGWIPGYYIVMAISFIQILYFTQKEGGLLAFPTQVRIAYFAFTLFGLWTVTRFPIYISTTDRYSNGHIYRQLFYCTCAEINAVE